MEMIPSRGTGRAVAFAYVQQVIALGVLFVFNAVVPRMVGLPAFGEFAALQGLIFTVKAVLGGGFDLLVLRAAGPVPGSIDRAALRRLLACRVATVLVGGALVLAFPGTLLRGVADPPAMAPRVAALLVTTGLSGFLVSALAAARLGLGTTLLMVAHGAAYVAAPVAWTIGRGASASTLVEGCIAVFVATIIAEFLLLRRVPDAPGSVLPSGARLWRDSLATSGSMLFDAARIALPFWLAASLVAPHGLALVRIVLSVAGAAVAVLPLQPQLLVPLGGLRAEGETRLTELTRLLATSAALATVGGSAALAVVLYRAEASALLRVAAVAVWCTWAMVWARLASSLAIGRLGATELGRHSLVAVALIAVLSLAVAHADATGTWLPLAPAAGSASVAVLLATPSVRAGLRAWGDLVWLALASGVAMWGSHAAAPGIALALVTALGGGYLSWSRGAWLPLLRATLARRVVA
jgi:hypothetical protein